MKKSYAISRLGGSPPAVARLLGISRQAVFKWKDPLTPRVEQKVREALQQQATAK